MWCYKYVTPWLSKFPLCPKCKHVVPNSWDLFVISPALRLSLFVTDEFVTWYERHEDKERPLSEGGLRVGQMKTGGALSHRSASVLKAGDCQEEVSHLEWLWQISWFYYTLEWHFQLIKNRNLRSKPLENIWLTFSDSTSILCSSNTCRQ